VLVVADLAAPGEDSRSADRRYAAAGMIQMAATGAWAVLGGLAVTYGRYRPIVNLGSALLLLVPRNRIEPAAKPVVGEYRAMLTEITRALLQLFRKASLRAGSRFGGDEEARGMRVRCRPRLQTRVSRGRSSSGRPGTLPTGA
jgi:hypothetical protein